jgi:hypothetical protein
MLGDRQKGCVFHGHDKLVLDMIIEIEEGAIGRPIENRTDRPFMMLGGTEAVQRNLDPASQEDFTVMGYAKQQEFVAKAEDLLDRFHGRSLGLSGREFSSVGHGLVFSFQEEINGLDILLVKGEKIVYKTRGTAFVSDGSKAVLKGSDGIVCVSNGRSVIVKQ